MGKYSQKLFGGNSGPKEPGKYSRRLFSNKQEYVGNPYVKDTDETSTITAKPVQEPSGNEWYKPADFSTLMKAGFVDDNDAKIKLFSESRGIPADRYEVKDGEIWFQGQDGRMYPETPKEVGNLLKALAAESVASAPADVGASVGAVSPVPGGAMGGAAIGEFIRKKIGELFFGDKQGKDDYAADMAVQAALGGIDSKLAKSLFDSLSSMKIKRATGGKISNDFTRVVGDLSPMQRAEGRAFKQKAEDIGVDLKPHQAMDDPALTGYYSLLRDNPKTARAIRENDNKLDKQVFTAGQDLLSSIHKGMTDPFEVGSELSDLGNKAIKKKLEVAQKAAKPFYDKAKDVDNVDVSPVLDRIGDLKTKLKPGMPAYSEMTRLEKMLLKGDKESPETSLEVLDNVKKHIDHILDKLSPSTGQAPAITKKMKKDIAELKDILTTQADKVSPDYAKARGIYTKLMPGITRAEKGILGDLKRLQKDNQIERAVSKVFSSPRTIRITKQAAMKHDPELWGKVVAEYMRDSLEAATKTAQGSGGKVINRPGKYVSRMWDLSSQKKLKIAMDGMTDVDGNPLYPRVKDFFDVMSKASIGHGKESATQPRFKMEKDLQGAAGKVGTSLLGFRYAAMRFFLKNKQDKTFDRNAKKLLDLMQTQEGVDLIAMAKGYGPKTEKGIVAATTLLLMATESGADRGVDVISTYLDQRNQSKSKKE